jgi:O-antigen/teichoic acid export membrane protein
MRRKAQDATPGGADEPGGQGRPERRGMRVLSSGLVVAVGTGLGNVLAYGFNLALSRGLGPHGYAQLGTLLAVFLIGSVPGMAVQAVSARRLAVTFDGPPEARVELCRRLRVRAMAAGAAVAVLFLAVAPAISVLLPSVTTAGVAWTGVSLAAFTVFSGYLGLAQGTRRFGTMTVLFLAAHSTRLVIGVAAAQAGASPTAVMAAQTGAWALAAVAGHFLLRELTDLSGLAADTGLEGLDGTGGLGRPGARDGAGSVEEMPPAASIPAPRGEPDLGPRRPAPGYSAELLRACGGLGGIIILANLDVLLAGRYLSDGDLGRYNTAALIARAAFFAPAFVAILAYPRLARAEERRRALLLSLLITAASGVCGVLLTALGGDRLIKAAFGTKYTDSAGSFDLGAHGWLFASLGALLALVNLALLDGVARRSHVVSAVVLGGIVLETGAIVGFAHHSADQIITAATACALLTAIVSVTACLAARPVPATLATPPPKGGAVGALPQTSG